MSYQGQGGLCQDIQTRLDNIVRNMSPSQLRTNAGFIAALTDTRNTATFEQVPIAARNGKNYAVEINYSRRALESEVVESAPSDLCGTSPESTFIPETVVASQHVTLKRSVNIGTGRDICIEENVERMARTIREMFDALMQVMDKKLITIASTLNGEYIDGTTTKNFDILGNKGGEKYALAQGAIDLGTEFAQMIMGDPIPFVLGSQNLYNYAKYQRIACCNDVGLQVGELSGDLIPAVDWNTSTILGANGFLAWLPGAIQLLEVPQNVGQFAWDWDSAMHAGSLSGVLTDPITGVLFDLDITWDACDKIHHITVSKKYDIWGYPLDAFGAGDRMDGKNFIVQGNLLEKTIAY